MRSPRLTTAVATGVGLVSLLALHAWGADVEAGAQRKDASVSTRPSSSLLRQWTEPAPAQRTAYNGPRTGVIGQLFQQPPMQGYGGINTPTLPLAPAQLPPGYGMDAGQLAPTVGSRFSANRLAPPNYVQPPMGAASHGAGGYAPPVDSANFGSPYAAGYDPRGYGTGDVWQPAVPTQSSVGDGTTGDMDYPFDTSGLGAGLNLPAPSSAATGASTAIPLPANIDAHDGYNAFGYQPMGAANRRPYDQPYADGIDGEFASSSSSGCRDLCAVDPCGPRAWWRAEVLLGWLNGYDTPALLASNPVGSDLNRIGELTYNQTTVLYGGDNIGDDIRAGGRFVGGFWFDPCRKWGFQADAFGIGNDDENISLTSNGNPIVSRPFFDTDPANFAPNAHILALNGTAAGSFRADTSGRLISTSPAIRWNLLRRGGDSDQCVGCMSCFSDPCGGPGSDGSFDLTGDASGGAGGDSSRLDLTAGYRFLQLKEGFFAEEILRPDTTAFPAIPAGSSYTLVDDINTKNDYHAFELGAIWQRQSGKIIWDIAGSAAFGRLTRGYTLNGSTVFAEPSGATNSDVPGGFLVRPEDIGSHENTEFSVMPQARIGMAYCLQRNLRLHVDYSFLYLADVFRPGSLMANEFNGQQLLAPPANGVGTAPPMTSRDDVYFHALSLGISCNY